MKDIREQIIEIIERNCTGSLHPYIYKKECAAEILALPLYPKEFLEWIGKDYIRVEGGWFHRCESQNITNLKTTDELYEFWKSLPK